MIILEPESNDAKRQRAIQAAIDAVMAEYSKATANLHYVDKLVVSNGVNKRLLERMDRKERGKAITVNRTGWEYKRHENTRDHSLYEREYKRE